jgi:transglutaminase-like putative cysteine protease
VSCIKLYIFVLNLFSGRRQPVQIAGRSWKIIRYKQLIYQIRTKVARMPIDGTGNYVVAQWLSPLVDTRLKTQWSRVRIRLPPQSPERDQEILYDCVWKTHLMVGGVPAWVNSFNFFLIYGNKISYRVTVWYAWRELYVRFSWLLRSISICIIGIYCMSI